ncbi:hypothetical protein KBX37_11400 [Micromonospora sp. U56]|uniref:hypothetical protein n=1 Tax=Micromonospora sp. U56 TaxID=2824900 RepID=UPI001B39A1D0|nr:hypothetical protein [Micromonospora sp. U56]MBQ0893694.1 hypothetical protein [Micromonospora sp. U56]
MEDLRSEAAEKLAELRAEVDAINNALRVDVRNIDLPPIPPVPDADASGVYGLPLLDSDWPFAEQCRRLIASKAYRAGVES